MTARTPAKRAAKPARPRMTLAETMAELEAAGTEQARKTYTRHGAPAPIQRLHLPEHRNSDDSGQVAAGGPQQGDPAWRDRGRFREAT